MGYALITIRPTVIPGHVQRFYLDISSQGLRQRTISGLILLENDQSSYLIKDGELYKCCFRHLHQIIQR
jgi:hypothetical protein